MARDDHELTKKEIIRQVNLMLDVINANLEGKQNVILERIEGTHDRLDKLNGKVLKHDQIINSALETRAKTQQETDDKFVAVDKKIDNHDIYCPMKTHGVTKRQLNAALIKSIVVISLLITIILGVKELIFT